MKYSASEVLQYVIEEDVKFIRLAFCDITGRPKNVSIVPQELERAFEHGIAFDGSAINGFSDEVNSDLFLFPNPETLTVLPWRPEHGKVVRMFCDVRYPDGRQFEHDTRGILKNAIEDAERAGCTFKFGSELEFYLFKLDEDGEPTKKPYDRATYMDVAPEDKGENIRREICLTLEQMGIRPESSHHEEGPGQNEIDFRYSDPLTAADNAVTFLSVVKTIAARNGLCADFSPKPLSDESGSGFHINMSVKKDGVDCMLPMIAGVLQNITDITMFLNPCESSYRRLGAKKAPKFISWSYDNRSQLIRIPAAKGEFKRCELRSPDCMANPYLAFALLIWAGLEGIKEKLPLPQEASLNIYTADHIQLAKLKSLPSTLSDAKRVALSSEFLPRCLPQSLIDWFCKM